MSDMLTHTGLMAWHVLRECQTTKVHRWNLNETDSMDHIKLSGILGLGKEREMWKKNWNISQAGMRSFSYFYSIIQYINQIYSGITCGRVLNGELYTWKLYKLINLCWSDQHRLINLYNFHVQYNTLGICIIHKNLEVPNREFLS